MVIKAITPLEIANRLQTLGYLKDIEFDKYPEHWSKIDQYLISFSISKGINEIVMKLNRLEEDFVDPMRNDIIDIICSIFLSSKRIIQIDYDNNTLSGNIKQIKEDTLSIEYDTENNSNSSTASPLDEMIDFLRNQAYQNLSVYRYLYPYYQYFSKEKIL